ncbi:MAG: hypothetical protein HYY04_06510 [Chloroflexi bacterium]|nr:hypothetical protein [Chloroflexota bacterium]
MSGLSSLFGLVTIVTLGLGLSLTVQGPLYGLVLAVLLLATAVGTTQSLQRIVGRAKDQPRAGTYWTLPTLLVLGAALFLRLPLFTTGPALATGLVVTAALLLVVLHAERYQAGRAPFSAEFISYIVAFMLYSAIYAPRTRSLYSATTIAVVTALLTVELLRRSIRSERQVWLYAGVVGLLLGELTWALNYWAVSTMTGGLLLLLAFYALIGLIPHGLDGRLARQVGFELAVVLLVGIGLLASTGVGR